MQSPDSRAHADLLVLVVRHDVKDSGEFGRAIKRMVAVLLPSLEHLCSWFIAERARRDPVAMSATTLLSVKKAG
jgi:hypothetical protein